MGKAVVLATILYGGFESEKQLYVNYKSTYEENAFIDASPNAGTKHLNRIRWSNEINGVECFIGLREVQEKSDSLTVEMVSIIVSNRREVD